MHSQSIIKTLYQRLTKEALNVEQDLQSWKKKRMKFLVKRIQRLKEQYITFVQIEAPTQMVLQWLSFKIVGRLSKEIW